MRHGDKLLLAMRARMQDAAMGLVVEGDEGFWVVGDGGA